MSVAVVYECVAIYECVAVVYVVCGDGLWALTDEQRKMADTVTIPRGSAVPEVTAGLVLHTVQAMSKYLGAVGVGRRVSLTVNDPHLSPSHPTPGLRGEGWNVPVSGGERECAGSSERGAQREASWGAVMGGCLGQ